MVRLILDNFCLRSVLAPEGMLVLGAWYGGMVVFRSWEAMSVVATAADRTSDLVIRPSFPVPSIWSGWSCLPALIFRQKVRRLTLCDVCVFFQLERMRFVACRYSLFFFFRIDQGNQSPILRSWPMSAFQWMTPAFSAGNSNVVFFRFKFTDGPHPC